MSEKLLIPRDLFGLSFYCFPHSKQTAVNQADALTTLTFEAKVAVKQELSLLFVMYVAITRYVTI